jgi:RHH-type proline utilization regulon transcriptional repressor/proline dehydrogenase/delta 1-pyrroline-5-carboxylate dehydrogenase
VFGPVLHVLRYKRDDLDRVIDDINATGYGLTFGLHTRIDETIARVTRRIRAGNIYINRNIIGAAVGVQAFGGHGMSGTGPKAGGPLYLLRLVRAGAAPELPGVGAAESALRPARDYCAWLHSRGNDPVSQRCQRCIDRSPLGMTSELAGPVGERNVYSLLARGRIAAMPGTESGLLLQIGAALATGNEVVVAMGAAGQDVLASLPASVAARISVVTDWAGAGPLAGILFEGDAEGLRAVDHMAAELPGALVPVYALTTDQLVGGMLDYPLHWLVEERSVSTNTSAAGGNASLMSIG